MNSRKFCWIVFAALWRSSCSRSGAAMALNSALAMASMDACIWTLLRRRIFPRSMPASAAAFFTTLIMSVAPPIPGMPPRSRRPPT